ncbi:MAG: glycogen synthase GlgA [Acidobacteria bacterium]|nr:glycogen synthase GlgA [Acidobacteriota bacterium]
MPATSRLARPRKHDALLVYMISSEAVPFAKTGGLGDVAGALPLALGRLGHDVTVILPRYRGSEPALASTDRRVVPLGGRPFDVAFLVRPLGENARAVLVDCPELFDREGIYGWGITDHPDNPRRFALLSRAALEYIRDAGVRPSIIHAHDWPTGLAPLYLHTRFREDPLIGGVATVFTIHNLAYQGLYPPEWLPALEVSWDLFTPEGIEFWGRLSLLKAGINFSDVITTVSRRYAKEILTPELGFGFDGVLRRRAADLVGILNGIDEERWNPATDQLVPVRYTADSLEAKADCKRELLRAFGLRAETPDLERPVVAIISRLVDQKGFDFLGQVLDELPRLGATFLLLGSGDPGYETMWRQLAAGYPERVGVHIGFDERLAHLMEAGADMLLMPSRYEPCGLNQMYSLRYGTVPIVRATGGLDDTVRNYSEKSGRGTGFTFEQPSGAALLRALRRALRVYQHKDEWRALQQQGMRQDHSWDASAREYVKVYRRAAARHAAFRPTTAP